MRIFELIRSIPIALHQSSDIISNILQSLSHSIVELKFSLGFETVSVENF